MIQNPIVSFLRYYIRGLSALLIPLFLFLLLPTAFVNATSLAEQTAGIPKGNWYVFDGTSGVVLTGNSSSGFTSLAACKAYIDSLGDPVGYSCQMQISAPAGGFTSSGGSNSAPSSVTNGNSYILDSSSGTGLTGPNASGFTSQAACQTYVDSLGDPPGYSCQVKINQITSTGSAGKTGSLTTGPIGAGASSPAGGLEPACPKTGCGWNELMQLATGVMRFLIYDLAAPLAAISFAIAGVMWMTAGGNEAQVKKAKTIFTSVAIGFILILGSWLIVYTIVTMLVNPGAFDVTQFLGPPTASGQ